MSFFFVSPPIGPRDLHSFPTRRSSDLGHGALECRDGRLQRLRWVLPAADLRLGHLVPGRAKDRKSTRLNSSHLVISYAVFCLKKKKVSTEQQQPHYDDRLDGEDTEGVR